MSEWIPVRKKPVTVKAIDFNPPPPEPPERNEYVEELAKLGVQVFWSVPAQRWMIFDSTQEGWVPINPGDKIIEGIQGEHYPCASSVFEVTYEQID